MAACGRDHSLILGHNGSVWACGSNEAGQLGKGIGKKVFTAVQVQGLPEITACACGNHSSVFLDVYGSVWVLGSNENGELGIGNAKRSEVPQKVEIPAKIKILSCGAFHSICIDENFKAWSFGYNAKGQLGLGINESINVPQQIRNLESISSVACGRDFSIFLTHNTEVYACGSNVYGQLGLGDQNTRTRACKIPGLTQVLQIACGFSHTAVLLGSGVIYTCGYNKYGQLGHGDTKHRYTLQKVSQVPRAAFVACRYYNTEIIDYQSFEWSCGYVNEDEDNSVFEKDSDLNNIASLACGGYHTIAQKKDGNFVVYGHNSRGQLGLGHAKKEESPQILKSFSVDFWTMDKELCQWAEGDLELLKDLETNITSLAESRQHHSQQEKKIEIPAGHWESWKQAHEFLNSKLSQIHSIQSEAKRGDQSERHLKVLQLEQRKQQLEKQLQLTEALILDAAVSLQLFLDIMKEGTDKPLSTLQTLTAKAKQYSLLEDKMAEKFIALMQSKGLHEVQGEEVALILWRMGLLQYSQSFIELGIDGSLLVVADQILLHDLGMSRRDACCFLYHRDLMAQPRYIDRIDENSECDDCVICWHNSSEKTEDLLEEFEISLDSKILHENSWTAGYLIYLTGFVEEFSVSAAEGFRLRVQFQQWIDIHQQHLSLLGVPQY